MDIGSILNDAFDYTKRMFIDLGRLIILIVLDVIPIVNFIVVGYAAKVIRDSPSSNEPPVLKDYVEMWIQGLKIVVASIVWMIIPIILIATSFGLGALNLGFGFFLFLGTWMVIAIVVAFMITIVLAMSIVHMIRHDNFGKAFAVGEILKIIGRIGWGKYILWLIIIFVIALVLGAIGTIPFVGWIISLILAPLLSVFVARSASSIYLEGASIPTVTPSVAKYCNHCGTGITSNDLFCPKCGQKVD